MCKYKNSSYLIFLLKLALAIASSNTMANTRSVANKLVLPVTLPETNDKTKNIITLSLSKCIEFEKDSEHWIVNKHEIYYEFLLNLSRSNLDTYCQLL